jgi:hypothetical protein
MAQDAEFKQFSYLIDNIYEPKYKNRFVLTINNVPLRTEATTLDKVVQASGSQHSGLMIGLDTAKRPIYSVESKEIAKFNEKSFYAGTPSHDNKMSCEFYDYITKGTQASSSADILYRWYNTVYNLDKGSQGFKKEYCTTAHLFLLDPNGKEIEHWVYTNFWPISIDFGELGYSTAEACKITAEFQYDKVKLVSYADTSPTAIGNGTYLNEASTTEAV